METKKVNIPKKGAARKWTQKLKELGKQKPPKDLVDAINRKDRSLILYFPDCSRP